jgi:hypothetical protein
LGTYIGGRLFKNYVSNVDITQLQMRLKYDIRSSYPCAQTQCHEDGGVEVQFHILLPLALDGGE